MSAMDIDDILAGFQPDNGVVLRADANEIANDVRTLKQAWISERMCPELLDFESSLLDRIMERIRVQMEYIEQNTIELSGPDIKVKLLIVESELERIKFVIRAYLRARLTKIDRYAMFIKSDEDELRKLSSKEVIYLERHQEILERLYNTQFLDSMPESLRKLDEKNGTISMVEEPDLHGVVFIKVINNVAGTLRISDDDEVELERGGIHAVRYSAVKSYIASGDVALI